MNPPQVYTEKLEFTAQTCSCCMYCEVEISMLVPTGTHEGQTATYMQPHGYVPREHGSCLSSTIYIQICKFILIVTSI